MPAAVAATVAMANPTNAHTESYPTYRQEGSSFDSGALLMLTPEKGGARGFYHTT
jgi:hypothetical protein